MRRCGPLPPLLVLTDRHTAAAAGRSLEATVAAALDAGAPAVLLRDKDLPRAERAPLGCRLGALVDGAGAQLLIASETRLARQLGATAVHLAAGEELPERHGLVVGRSVHRALELARAATEGLDYVTLSPIFATASKPGYGPTLGIAGLSEACRIPSAPPVWALGGIRPGTAAPCLAAGAAGVAVMGAVMGAADPGGVVRALLDEIRSASAQGASR